MRKSIDAFDYAGHICKAMKRGVLLTTKAGEKVNTMTIGWGHLGIEWNKPVFVAYVRESRYTRQLLDETGEFTVNVPLGECDSKILRLCGSRSGRDLDKIADLGLHLMESEEVDVPGIQELPLTLECRVLLRQLQKAEHLPQDIQNRFYPIEALTGEPDRHIAYYGEVLNAWIAEDN